MVFDVYSVSFRYELAEECADDDDAKVAITELRKSVLEELKMHDSFVQVIYYNLSLFIVFCFSFEIT